MRDEKKGENCFKRSLELFCDLPGGRRYRLCHGVLRHPTTGIRFYHGSVEDKLKDKVLGLRKYKRKIECAAAAHFYLLYQIQPSEVRTFTARAVAKQVLETHHSGPWIEVEGVHY